VSEQVQEPEVEETVTRFKVKRGAIRKPGGKTFAKATDFLMQGDMIPGMFSEKQLRSWERDGKVQVAEVTMDVAQAAEEAIKARSKWAVNPTKLVRKTFEELLIMVNEIDPDFDANSLEDEEACVALLTSGWDPRYSEVVAPATDRSRPEALALHNMEQDVEGTRATQTSNTPQSQGAVEAMARAREAAQAPEE